MCSAYLYRRGPSDHIFGYISRALYTAKPYDR